MSETTPDRENLPTWGHDPAPTESLEHPAPEEETGDVDEIPQLNDAEIDESKDDDDKVGFRYARQLPVCLGPAGFANMSPMAAHGPGRATSPDLEPGPSTAGGFAG